MTEENAMKQPEKEEEMVMETTEETKSETLEQSRGEDGSDIEKLNQEKKISEVNSEVQVLCTECQTLMNKKDGIKIYECPRCNSWIPIKETKAQQIQALKSKLEALESGE